MTAQLSKPAVPAVPAWNNKDPESDLKRIVNENRRQWNEAYAGYVIRERNWKLIASLSLSVAVICSIGMVILGTQNKMVPYVVEVDKLGTAVGVQRADVAAKPDSRIIRSQLAHWIENVRSLYQDIGADRVNITAAYSMIRRNDAAYNALNEYFIKNDPFKRAENEGVSVSVSTVLPLSEKTWQVQWTENVHSSKGDPIASIPMQANISVDIDPPTDETALLRNPTGLYITNFNWSQRL